MINLLIDIFKFILNNVVMPILAVLLLMSPLILIGLLMASASNEPSNYVPTVQDKRVESPKNNDSYIGDITDPQWNFMYGK